MPRRPKPGSGTCGRKGGRHEVDLIVERDNGKVVAIEVKLGKSPGPREVKHLNWLAKELGDDLLDAAVITTGRDAYRRPQDQIAVVPRLSSALSRPEANATTGRVWPGRLQTYLR
jgi:predicted AAA+ superfamily ATPase